MDSCYFKDDDFLINNGYNSCISNQLRQQLSPCTSKIYNYNGMGNNGHMINVPITLLPPSNRFSTKNPV